MIYPTFNKFNRSFVIRIEKDRTPFSKYYTLKDEIKDFSLLIDGKSVFDVPTKSKEETHKKIIEMSKNND